MGLDLEDAQTVHPADELAQYGLTGSAVSDEKTVSHGLPEDAVDAKNVIQNLVKDDKRDIKLFFVEHAKPGSEELTKVFSAHLTSVLA